MDTPYRQLAKQFSVGQIVRIKHRPYHWDGNGAVGIIEEIDIAYGLYVKFLNRHASYFNFHNVAPADGPLTGCPADSPCQWAKTQKAD